MIKTAKNLAGMLALRRMIKRRKPHFRTHDSHKRKEIKPNWRRPRGLHSKTRMGMKGYLKTVRTGYGSPRIVKGLTRTGLVPVIVHNIEGLSGLDKNTQGIVVSASVGNRKRMAIIKGAVEQGFNVINFKEPLKKLADINNEFEQRKKLKIEEKKAGDKKKEAEKKEKKRPEKAGKEEGKERETIDEKLSDEEKKAQEKLEKDRLLTKRD